jgi:predicted DCC family thiol-disulfide oxidoreductase YuxK
MPATTTPADLPVASPPSESRPRAIVFFDGVCGLCNATVDYWITRDVRGRLAFAPLQGETAARYLPEAFRQDLKSMALRTEEGDIYTRSAAAARILWRIGGVWTLLGALLWLIPLPVRDLGYRLVAAWRYRLFGRRETCRLPTGDEADRLLP